MPTTKNAPPKGARARAAGAKLAGKPPSASKTEMVEVVLPNDANLLGNILGGRVMHLIDITGAIAAHRHASSHVVTGKRTHTSTAYVTYVAIGENNQPHAVPPVLPRTAAERRRYREAGFRRRIRLAHRSGRGLGAETARLEKRRR